MKVSHLNQREVRILTDDADNILITEDGVENLTPTPKEIDDITKLVNSG